jgi:hypothetical protein
MKPRLNGFYLAILLLIAVLHHGEVQAQFYDEYPYPRDTYINPLGIEWKLSGTFGEPRGNHFHAGNDIRTNGAVGYKLYAIADGYVSRIKVSPYGYGKALYIAHDDGFTSVYAHLSKFSNVLDSLVRSYQFASESFVQDIYLDQGEVTVKQGELIGLSGNSGGSAGPHLHFEIRETGTQKPLNPLFFGYEVKDTRPPQIMGAKFTSVQSGYYNALGGNSEMYIPIDKLPDTLSVPAGRIAVGIHTLDQQDLSINRNGVFRVEMNVDGKQYFRATMDRLDFSHGRYVNAFRDFYERKQNKTVYNCYRLPGNRLDVYEVLENDGFIDLGAGQLRTLSIDVRDFHGNTSTVELVIRGETVRDKADADPDKTGEQLLLVRHEEHFNLRTDDFRIYIPAKTFYDDIPLIYSKRPIEQGGIHSDIHQLHDHLVPMHLAAVVQVAARDIPAALASRAVMVHKDLQGAEQSLTTFWKDGMVSARTREVGHFYVRLDTIAPELQLLNFSSRTNEFRGGQIRVKISDALSGIDSYNGFIDGRWVIFDYDAKRDLLTYDFDEYCPPGEHLLRLVVTDEVNNEVVKEIPFTVP